MRIFAVKGERIKKASFVCGFETTVEYFDESGAPVTIEECTRQQLDDTIRLHKSEITSTIATRMDQSDGLIYFHDYLADTAKANSAVGPFTPEVEQELIQDAIRMVNRVNTLTPEWFHALQDEKLKLIEDQSI